MFIQLTGRDADDRPFPVFVNPAHVDLVRPAKSGTYVGLAGDGGVVHATEQIDEVMALLQPTPADRPHQERPHSAALREYQRLILDADAVARARGDEHGLSDALDGRGQPYVSEWAGRLIAEAREDLGMPDDAEVRRDQD